MEVRKLIGLASFGLAVGCLVTFSLIRSPEEKYMTVTNKVLPACVEIQVIGETITYTLEDLFTGKEPQIKLRRVMGAGVYISPKGYVLTCAHLFKKFTKILSITVLSPVGDEVAGSLKITGESVDLALVKVDYYKATPYVKIANPRNLRVGQEVIAIGSPLGLSFSVTNGIISALYRDMENSYNVTQSNTALNPGNSGGPLFNLKGELVGINSFIVPPVNAPIFTGLGFSVQSGQILEFLVSAGKRYPELKNRHWISLLYNWL